MAASAAAPAVVSVAVIHPRPAAYAAAATALGAAAVLRPRIAPVLIVALSLAGMLAHGSLVVIGGTIVVTAATAFRVVTGDLPLRPAHGWIALLATLLIVAYVCPAAGTPTGLADHAYRFADLHGVLSGLALLAVTAACTPRPWTVARAVALAGAAASLYALVAGAHAAGRLQVPTLNANYLGILLALSLVAATGLARATRRPLWLLPAALCLAGMAATESRGAFLSAAAGLAAVAAQRRSLRLQAGVPLAAGGLAVAFSGVLAGLQRLVVGDRPVTDLAESREIRERAAGFAARAAAEHPLRGIGYGMFPGYAADSPGLGTYVAVHDDYLRLATETGFAALGVFVLLLVLGVRTAGGGGIAVARAVVLTYAAGLLFANLLSNQVVSAPFWTALGCLLAWSTPWRGGTREAPPLAEGNV